MPFGDKTLSQLPEQTPTHFGLAPNVEIISLDA
jgi:hypothetical protein